MHVPKAMALLQRFRAFRFLDAHHRVHHKYMLSNLNVILPLADLTLGTLRDGNGKRIGPFVRRKMPARASE
jgi:sterol desaturase/sphingolipid hydroxylase (fatty acid hydroxylase superfamily)